jgi:hypothetical protein
VKATIIVVFSFYAKSLLVAESKANCGYVMIIFFYLPVINKHFQFAFSNSKEVPWNKAYSTKTNLNPNASLLKFGERP